MSIYADNATAGYKQGSTGQQPDPEDELCKTGRFAYVTSWMKGNREYRIANKETDEERMRRFMEY